MAQHLCIVARDNPLLLGYLNIALAYLTRGGDELEIVIDRRPEPAAANGTLGHATDASVEQRRVLGVDDLLRSRGYAIVTREPGRDWRLAADPLDAEAIPSLEDEAAAEPAALRYLSSLSSSLSSPMGRRTLVAVGAFALIVGSTAVGVPGYLLDHAVGAADHAVGWLRSSSDERPAAAPTPPPDTRSPAARGVAVAPPGATPVPPTAPRASEVTPAATPAERPTPSAPETIAPARPAVAPPSPPRTATREPAPRERAARVEAHRVAAPPTPRPKAVREEAPAPPKAAVAAVSVQKAPTPEFQGAPRMELSRERDGNGRTLAVTVRLTDSGGRPLSAADVRIRRHLGNGGMRESRLEEGASEGSYRGTLPAGMPDAELTMRVTVGRKSLEVPLAE